jgi:hypothetical protein
MSDDYSDRLSDISLETDNTNIRNTINSELEKINTKNVKTINGCSCFSYCYRCLLSIYKSLFCCFIQSNTNEK